MNTKRLLKISSKFNKIIKKSFPNDPESDKQIKNKRHIKNLLYGISNIINEIENNKNKINFKEKNITPDILNRLKKLVEDIISKLKSKTFYILNEKNCDIIRNDLTKLNAIIKEIPVPARGSFFEQINIFQSKINVLFLKIREYVYQPIDEN